MWIEAKLPSVYLTWKILTFPWKVIYVIKSARNILKCIMKGIFLSPHIPILTLPPYRQKLLPVSHMFTGYFWQDILTCTLHSPGLATGWKASVFICILSIPQTRLPTLFYFIIIPSGSLQHHRAACLHCPSNLWVPMTVPTSAVVSRLHPFWVASY